MTENKYLQYIMYDKPIIYLPVKERQNYNDLQKLLVQAVINKEKDNIESIKKALDEFEKLKLSFNPIKMKDVLMFYTCQNCLTVEKNTQYTGFSAKQILKLIGMPYLDYICTLSNEKNCYMYKLKEMIMLACDVNENEVIILPNKDKSKYIISINKNNLWIDIDSNDFDEIRNIICLQNDILLPDESIHPELRKAFEDARRLKIQQNTTGKTGNIDDNIISFQIMLKIWDVNIIENMTIRRFYRIFSRYLRKYNHQLIKMAMLNGKIELKEPLEDWINNFDVSASEMYNDLKIDAEKFNNKIKSAH